MYTRALLSLAIGLIGVAASPCKPLTSASIVSSTALTSSVAEPTVSTSVESAVTETSTSAESLVTDTLTSTAVESTVTDLTTTALTATSADSTTLFTTETSAATTDFSSIETSADTTTADATTTTTDAPPVITTFAVVAGSGPAANNILKSDNGFGTPLYFGSSVTFPAQHYNIDAATGQIKAGAMSLCAWFTHSVANYAYITACNSDNENLTLGVVYLTCQAPTEGSALQCSVPVLSCTQLGGGVQSCAATTDRLSHFTMQGDTGLLNIVADGFTGINQTPVDLIVDQAAPSS